MLVISLTRLAREGVLGVEEEVPADHPAWADTSLRLATALSVRGHIRSLGGGEVSASLALGAALHRECRRCLEPVLEELQLEVFAVFAPASRGQDDDGEIRYFPVGSTELDLLDAVREEVILGISPYPLCRPECLGLCPRCGANRNLEACRCSEGGADPRWETLRVLRGQLERKNGGS